jgi:hypothetical protein
MIRVSNQDDVTMPGFEQVATDRAPNRACAINYETHKTTSSKYSKPTASSARILNLSNLILIPSSPHLFCHFNLFFFHRLKTF